MTPLEVLHYEVLDLTMKFHAEQHLTAYNGAFVVLKVACPFCSISAMHLSFVVQKLYL